MFGRLLLLGLSFTVLAGIAGSVCADTGADSTWIATLRGMTLKQARAAIMQHGWMPEDALRNWPDNLPYDKGEQRADRFAEAGYQETVICDTDTLHCTLVYINSTVDTELTLTTDGDTADSATVVDTHVGAPQPQI